MRLLLSVVFVLAGCGSGESVDNNNHGYGFQYDVQGTSGVKLRYSSAPPANPMLTDPAYYETVFAKTETCTGLSAPMPPFVILTKVGELGFDDQGRMIVGHYSRDPDLILIQFDHTEQFAHESIHYLLQINTGNLDPGHTSRFFDDCV